MGTAIAWVAGVGMLMVASSETRFDRVLGEAVRSQYRVSRRLRKQNYSVDHMLRSSRRGLFGCGCLFVALAVWSAWVLAA